MAVTVFAGRAIGVVCHHAVGCGEIHRVGVGVGAHAIHHIAQQRRIGGVELRNHGGAICAHQKQSRAIGGNPFTIGGIHCDMRHCDAIEQIVGKVGAIVARHFDMVEAEIGREGIVGVKHQHAIVGSHPHVAVEVFAKRVDVVPRNHIAILVVDRAGRIGFGARLRRGGAAIVDKEQRFAEITARKHLHIATFQREEHRALRSHRLRHIHRNPIACAHRGKRLFILRQHKEIAANGCARLYSPEVATAVDSDGRVAVVAAERMLHGRIFPAVGVHHLSIGHLMHAIPPVAHEIGVGISRSKHRVIATAIFDGRLRRYIRDGHPVERVYPGRQILLVDPLVGAGRTHIEFALCIIVCQIVRGFKRKCYGLIERLVGCLMQAVFAHCPQRAVAVFVGAIHLFAALHLLQVSAGGIECEIAFGIKAIYQIARRCGLHIVGIVGLRFLNSGRGLFRLVKIHFRYESPSREYQQAIVGDRAQSSVIVGEVGLQKRHRADGFVVLVRPSVVQIVTLAQ